jgi:hypothetical protein
MVSRANLLFIFLTSRQKTLKKISGFVFSQINRREFFMASNRKVKGQLTADQQAARAGWFWIFGNRL